METLGSLCDKLTIVKLKQYHSIEETRLQSLNEQEKQLKKEIDCYVVDVFSGKIGLENITFAANKIYKSSNMQLRNVQGEIGEVFSELAKINCELWHEQEKIYDFENVPIEEKNNVVKSIAVLNLERNHCIDNINNLVYKLIEKK